MTVRERVLAALEHRQPDKTPYCVEFTQVAHAKMVDYYADPQFAQNIGNCFTFFSCAPHDAWREIRPDVWQDYFGVQWDRSVDKDIGVVANRLVTPDNVDDYVFPDPDNPATWQPVAASCANKGDAFVVANLGFSLFERAWTLAGMENLLMAMVADPAFAHRLLDRILEYNLRVVDKACASGIDAMMFGDDWGSQRGVMMGLDLWRAFIGPRVREMYAAAKRHGKFVFIHSCGKVDELFPDLISYGLNVFNPFQPEVIDVFDAKQRYGNDLCFYGGISTQRMLPYATPGETRDQVKRLIDVVGKNGGYFAAPAHAIPPDAKSDNIAAMIEVLQNQ
jgi:uroporphyrinogen decarboxylase